MLAQSFPRLYELYSMSDRGHLSNYFCDFEKKLRNPLAQQSYQRIENNLSRLDIVAWDQLRKKAVNYVTPKKINHERGYEQLFNCLNEAQGYIFLHDRGYSQIAFIEENNATTPDLLAIQQNDTALLEVKTINYSVKEIEYVIRNFPKEVRNVQYGLPKELLKKLVDTIDKARKQLLEYESEKPHKRICLVIIKLDSDAMLAAINYDELKSFVQSQSDNCVEVVHISQ